MFPRSAVVAVALAFVGLAAPASAGIVTFLGHDAGLSNSARLGSYPNAQAARDQFLANLTQIRTETFESFADDTSLAGSGIAMSFGPTTATLRSGHGKIEQLASGTNGLGRYPLSGDRYVETGGALELTFSAPQVAFGFFGIDIGDFDGQVTLMLDDGPETLINIANPIGIVGGGVLYFGLIADRAFTKVTFGNTATGFDEFGFDDFTIASREQVIPVVPTPGAGLGGLLLLAGLSLPRLLRRRVAG
jgi:hypothetical protein